VDYRVQIDDSDVVLRVAARRHRACGSAKSATVAAGACVPLPSGGG
jgi:hypothetical protein